MRDLERLNLGFQAAEFLDVPDLFTNLIRTKEVPKAAKNPEAAQDDIDEQLRTTIIGLEELCLEDGLFSDILFKLEDGTCSAHKPLLMARSDMMCAMFSHEEFFKEASARVIHFPGVKRLTFHELLYYLYTDKSPRVTTNSCVDLIELANRLCLPR